MHFRNNLFLGRDTPGRGIMTWANATDAFSSDYNGFRPNKGVAEQYTWLAPGAGQRLYEPRPEDWKSFATLADFRAATRQETHGIEVDFDDFEGLVPPDPANRHAVYHAVDLNFRLKPTGKAVDAGVADSDRERRLHGPRAGPGRTGSRKAGAEVRAEVAQRAAVLPVAAKHTVAAGASSDRLSAMSEGMAASGQGLTDRRSLLDEGIRPGSNTYSGERGEVVDCDVNEIPAYGYGSHDGDGMRRMLPGS